MFIVVFFVEHDVVEASTARFADVSELFQMDVVYVYEEAGPFGCFVGTQRTSEQFVFTVRGIVSPKVVCFFEFFVANGALEVFFVRFNVFFDLSLFLVFCGACIAYVQFLHFVEFVSMLVKIDRRVFGFPVGHQSPFSGKNLTALLTGPLFVEVVGSLILRNYLYYVR